MPQFQYESVLGLDIECLAVQSNAASIVANVAR
jgi:hypothetical protein